MPLKLTVPSLLAQDEKAPISARAHLRSDKISPAEINDTLRHIMDSLGAITRAMRSQKYIEDADVIIYGPGGGGSSSSNLNRIAGRWTSGSWGTAVGHSSAHRIPCHRDR